MDLTTIKWPKKEEDLTKLFIFEICKYAMEKDFIRSYESFPISIPNKYDKFFNAYMYDGVNPALDTSIYHREFNITIADFLIMIKDTRLISLEHKQAIISFVFSEMLDERKTNDRIEYFSKC